MINIDQHVHSKISHDGISTIGEYIKCAKNDSKNIDLMDMIFIQIYL